MIKNRWRVNRYEWNQIVTIRASFAELFGDKERMFAWGELEDMENVDGYLIFDSWARREGYFE